MRRLPLVLWILAVAAMLPAAAINAALDWGNTLDLVANVGFTLLILGAATTGAVVATRVPANAIGWTLLALGLGLAVGLLTGAYAEAGPLPADEWMAWLGNWLPLVALFGATAALLLLFPDGRLVSRRWRPVAWVCAIGVALAGLGSALDRGRSARPSCRTRSAPRGPRTSSCAASSPSPTCWRCRCCWRRPPRWSCASAARAASSGCS